MTQRHVQDLEIALIDTVETELATMRSFCQPDFPCDLATTVAMRMSRAVVSAICRLGISSADTQPSVVSTGTADKIRLACQELESLSMQYESRLRELAEEDPARQSWAA
jgi:hypothetical protein